MNDHQSNNNDEAEALYAYLKGQSSAGDPDLPAEEARLADELASAAEEIQPDPAFMAALEKQLLGEKVQTESTGAYRRAPTPTISSRLLLATRGMVYIGLAALFFLGLAWAIQTLLPGRPATGALPPPSASLPVQAITAAPVGELSATEHSTAAPITPSSYTSPMFPGSQIVLQAGFPESPSEVGVYTLVLDEPLTVDSARAAAERLGITGSVYQMPSEFSDSVNYLVTDGTRQLIFVNSTSYFSYTPDITTVLDEHGEPLSRAAQLDSADEYLKSLGLLDTTYQVDALQTRPGMVHYLPMLEGYPVRFSMLRAPGWEVQIDSQGQVKRIEGYLQKYQELGRYPVISAEEAWQKVFSSDAPSGIESSTISGLPSPVQTWQRELPLDQPLELFGYLEVLQPAEAGAAPRITFNNFPVTGDVQRLSQAGQGGSFLQVLGQLTKGSDGRTSLQVSGWQVSPFPDQTLEGAIQRAGNQAYLVAGDRRLLLPELPAEVSDGMQVHVRGVVLEQPEPTLDWSLVQTSGGGGGGGGGGGSGFAALNLEGTASGDSQLTPTFVPLAETGQRVEGLSGVIFVTLIQQQDGSTNQLIQMMLETAPDWSKGLSVRLEGPGMAGIEAYHNLSVRAWGVIKNPSGMDPVLEVERYEPLYPGLSIQAWLGTSESLALEGQAVLRFTAQDGAQYILASSIDAEPDSAAGTPGEAIIIEGYVSPDEQFGGYPVLTDFGTQVAQGISDLSGYQPDAAQPLVIEQPPPATPPGELIVEKIELAYYAPDLRGGSPPPAGRPFYVQPVWRFSGHYSDGSLFEILVQALQPEYLK